MSSSGAGRGNLACYLVIAASLILFGACPAIAEDNSAPVAGSDYDWSGLYAGVNAGAAFGSFKAVTATNAGGYFGDFGPPFFFMASDVSAVNRYGNQTISSDGFS